MFREFISRIGLFFMLVGVGVLVLFMASNGAGKANFDYLFWAVLSIIVGFLLRRHRGSAPSANRFSIVRRLRRPGRDRKEGK